MSDYNFKVECVDDKGYPRLYTKGKTYEIKDGVFTWNDGDYVGVSTKIKNMSDLNKITSAIFEEVVELKQIQQYKGLKRMAKVGEWIMVVNSIFSRDDYSDGDICKITRASGDEVYFCDSKGEESVYLSQKEYVVLEGYNAIDLSSASNSQLMEELNKRLSQD